MHFLSLVFGKLNYREFFFLQKNLYPISLLPLGQFHVSYRTDIEGGRNRAKEEGEKEEEEEEEKRDILATPLVNGCLIDSRFHRDGNRESLVLNFIKSKIKKHCLLA